MDDKRTVHVEEQRANCPDCGKEFVEPAGSHWSIATRIGSHRRGAHMIVSEHARPSRRSELTGELYALPQRLRDHAKTLVALADEMETYIITTSDAREKLKEYQAFVDMAKKLR